MIPLFKVFMAPDVEDFLNPVLHSGYIGEGPQVKAFESEIAKFIDNPNVIAVNSGTSAIVMALRLAGVGYGDYVLTTPMTCLATNMAILSLGAHPIWTDILLDGNMDIKSVPDVNGRHIKAVMTVDWGGTPCNYTKIYSKAQQWGVPLIEDACQGLGALYEDRPLGNHADYVCFSFQAIKTLTTGDGGLLVVNNKEKLHEARLMKWFGLDRTKTATMRCEQDPPIWGYKFQMNDIAASIGLANARYLPELLARAGNYAKWYNVDLTGLDDVIVIEQEDNVRPSYWLYTILVRDAYRFIRYMAEQHVECSKSHTRNDTKSVFHRYYNNKLPGVDYFDKHHVCIPVGWWLTNSDVDYIITAIRTYRDEEYAPFTSTSPLWDSRDCAAQS